MPKGTKVKDPAAVALGRKGGKNSRANLTPEQRTQLAKKAALARWNKPKSAAEEPSKDAAKSAEVRAAKAAKKPRAKKPKPEEQ